VGRSGNHIGVLKRIQSLLQKSEGINMDGKVKEDTEYGSSAGILWKLQSLISKFQISASISTLVE